jgi:hypothetical protein
MMLTKFGCCTIGKQQSAWFVDHKLSASRCAAAKKPRTPQFELQPLCYPVFVRHSPAQHVVKGQNTMATKKKPTVKKAVPKKGKKAPKRGVRGKKPQAPGT